MSSNKSSKLIIGVHGLANKPEKETLAAWWEQSMLEGLKKNSRLPVESLDFLSVHWADVMYPSPDPKPDAYREAKSGDLKYYKDGWMDYVRSRVLDMGGDFLDFMKDKLDMDKTAEKVLKEKLPDLYRYYKKEAIRKVLRERLTAVITENRDKRLMLVAHSMGSIIAYDVLRELGREDPTLSVEHFVTIGSPLGLPHVKHMILKENPIIRTPSIVKNWTNFADRRDPVALDIHLSDDYEKNYAGVKVKDDLVMNDWGGLNHKSYGYLRTPEFSDVLKTFI